MSGAVRHTTAMDLLHRSLLALVLPPTAAFAQQAAAAQQAPSAKDVDQAVAAFFAADDKTSAGHTARLEVLQRLAALPPLDQKQQKAWQQKIEKLWAKGRTLQKTGDNWFWPADGKAGDERGRYIVGGETKKPKGLVIAMHGGGQGFGDPVGLAASYGPALQQLGLLMIAPGVLEQTDCGWTDSGTEEFVIDLVDAALRTWKIDADHVYFAGFSMGGHGAWSLGAHHADRTAALAASSGAPTPFRTAPGKPIDDVQDGVIPSLRNVFVAVFQALDDPQVTPDANQFAIKRLAEAETKWGGYVHDYWEVDKGGHTDPPGGPIALLRKIAGKVREPVPERLVWQPVLPWKRQFGWLYWDRPTLGAVVTANLDRKANAVAITCDKSADGLQVLLDARVLDLAREVVVTVNGAEVFRGLPIADLGTLLLTSDHPDPRLQFAVRVPGATAKH